MRPERRHGNAAAVTRRWAWVAACTMLALLGGTFAGAADVQLAWDPPPDQDLAGYMVHYKIGGTGAPYDGTGAIEGTSPVTVLLGELDDPLAPQFRLTGLADNQSYAIAVTAFNLNGLESGFSNEVTFAVTRDADTDGDGLMDALESKLGTAAGDADTDDDGLTDGEEDADHNGSVGEGETDPCRSDSDGDGLLDGTEVGVTLAQVGSDTDVDLFLEDADPASTTDPLNPDTDGDGVADGTEDLNRNGRCDAGETDPCNQPPRMAAGPDQVVPAGERVILDGSASVDPDGLLVTYEWTQTGGPPIALSSLELGVATGLAPVCEIDPVVLAFRLTGVDDRGDRSSDDCLVTVTPGTPPGDLCGWWDRLDLTYRGRNRWMEAVFVVRNAGGQPVPPITLDIWGSADDILDNTDRLCDAVVLEGLLPGESLQVRFSTKMDKLNGAGFILAVMDAAGETAESDEENNIVPLDLAP